MCKYLNQFIYNFNWLYFLYTYGWWSHFSIHELISHVKLISTEIVSFAPHFASLNCIPHGVQMSSKYSLFKNIYLYWDNNKKCPIWQQENNFMFKHFERVYMLYSNTQRTSITHIKTFISYLNTKFLESS